MFEHRLEGSRRPVSGGFRRVDRRAGRRRLRHVVPRRSGCRSNLLAPVGSLCRNRLCYFGSFLCFMVEQTCCLPVLTPSGQRETEKRNNQPSTFHNAPHKNCASFVSNLFIISFGLPVGYGYGVGSSLHGFAPKKPRPR